MNHEQLYTLLEAQHQLISTIALNRPLGHCLDTICENIEGILKEEQAKASVLLLEGKHLHHGGAPSLPQAYCEAIDGVEIGESVGSCGTAAFSKKQIIVTDIATDPLWQNYKGAALPHNLKACWSTPIISSNNEVMGTFAIYYSETKAPEAFHLKLIERFTHLASLALERAKSLSREQKMSAQLKANFDKFEAFTQVMPDLAIVLDEQGTHIDVFGAHDTLLHIDKDKTIGYKVSEILPPDQAERITNVITQTLNTQEIQIFEYQLPVLKGLRTFEGRVTKVDNYSPEHPEKKHVLWMARDITERCDAERKAEELAYYDPLTALPNRRMLKDRLQVLIDKVHRDHLNGAILFLDLDDFKRINDSLGHSVGDELLLKVSQRLKPILRATDTIARIGGDEFVILLESLEKEVGLICDDASLTAQKIIDAFQESFSISSGHFKIGISIGISLVQGGDITADEALKRADVAMYRAKEMGGCRYSFFDPELQKNLDFRLALENDLIRGVKDRQLFANFQPQLSPQGKLIGAEALIRWIHPLKGFIPPLDFINVAERQGFISNIQEIVLRESCDLLNQLEQEQLIDDQFKIAINISAVEFTNGALKKNLMKVLNEKKVSPDRIKLELTESMLMENRDSTIEQMQELKNLGFSFSIDDFGTGYSSLTYLHTFPVDELKIDKSFIDNMLISDVGSGIVNAIIALSNNLGFNTVAEGVEDSEQAKSLCQRNIKIMQGYHFAKPMPYNELLEWIKKQ